MLVRFLNLFLKHFFFSLFLNYFFNKIRKLKIMVYYISSKVEP